MNLRCTGIQTCLPMRVCKKGIQTWCCMALVSRMWMLYIVCNLSLKIEFLYSWIFKDIAIMCHLNKNQLSILILSGKAKLSMASCNIYIFLKIKKNGRLKRIQTFCKILKLERSESKIESEIFKFEKLEVLKIMKTSNKKSTQFF